MESPHFYGYKPLSWMVHHGPVGWSPCDPKVYEPLLFRRHGFHGFQLHRHRRRITCDASAKGEGFPRDVLSKKKIGAAEKKSLETIFNRP